MTLNILKCYAGASRSLGRYNQGSVAVSWKVTKDVQWVHAMIGCRFRSFKKFKFPLSCYRPPSSFTLYHQSPRYPEILNNYHCKHSSSHLKLNRNIHDGRDTSSSSLYYWPAAGQSGSTISSTATAANLPGTGRVLGLAYDAMGNALVSQMSKLVLRFGRTGKSVFIQFVFNLTHLLMLTQRLRQRKPDDTTNRKEFIDSDNSDSDHDTDSTATASNLPGTGRVIGLAYDRIGRVLVKKINRMAVKFGRGPDATAARIREYHERVLLKKRAEARENLEHGPEAMVFSSEMKPIRKDLKLLLRYAM